MVSGRWSLKGAVCFIISVASEEGFKINFRVMFEDFVKTTGSKSNRNQPSGACNDKEKGIWAVLSIPVLIPLLCQAGGFSLELYCLLHLFFDFIPPR